MTWVDERHPIGCDEFYMYDTTEKYYEDVHKTAKYIIDEIWNGQLKSERGELPRALVSVKELQLILSEEFTGCYDKETDEVYLCHFGEHYNALKELLSDMLVRKGIVSDKPVNKDVKTTGTMHIIEPMAFIPDIPKKIL
jgi:hypothetical protein